MSKKLPTFVDIFVIASLAALLTALNEAFVPNTALNEAKAELEKKLTEEENKRKLLESELDKANKEKANLAAALATEKKNRQEAEANAANLKTQLDNLSLIY